jgi:hypothetical protein
MPSYVPDRGPDIARNGRGFLERRLQELESEIYDASRGGLERWGAWRERRLSEAASNCLTALDQLIEVRIRALLKRRPKEERNLFWDLIAEQERELLEAEGCDDAE